MHVASQKTFILGYLFCPAIARRQAD